jgi:hypothetical protein
MAWCFVKHRDNFTFYLFTFNNNNNNIYNDDDGSDSSANKSVFFSGTYYLLNPRFHL